jgi:tRNA-splicing ligase RtcB
MAEEWAAAELSCFALDEVRQDATRVERWFGQKPQAQVLRVVLESGDEVKATADHPFWTPAGMVPLGQLEAGDRVGVVGFDGVPYQQSADEVVVSEADFVAQWARHGKGEGGNGLGQALAFLQANELLPLRYSSPAMPHFCKLAGFISGDGNSHFNSEGKGVTSFYGQPADLESIRGTVAALGLTASRLYTRDREHCIQTPYGECQFETTENHFKVVGSSFAVLLSCLGVAVGNKAEQDSEPPVWLDDAPPWQKRLFLAALFGAEMTTPAPVSGHGTIFGAPTLSMNKRKRCEASGRRYLEKLSEWLAEFGVKTQSLLTDAAPNSKSGEETVRLRLVLCNDSENLLALWSRVGYEFNSKRSARASQAVQYLKHKERHLAGRATAARGIVALASAGTRRRDIIEQFLPTVNQRFIERALYSGREFTPRVAEEFPTFKEYCEEVTEGLPESPMVWERIASIEPVEDFDELVYDFTVAHPDHNFIANGFVVSNCGVRLVRSNLFYRDVKQHIRPLVEALFRNIPSGVGRTGRYKFDRKELQHLLGQGPSYLRDRELCSMSDLDFTEAHGRLDGADPSEVSDHAMTRGAEQCGTLGSGNHFLEIQIVDHIFDEDAARVMGLEKDMVCVMIHSGSRGLGYQVCDDALASLRNTPKKYGIELPDRQLACAPVDSPEGRKYIAAMRAAANFAWCNRQLLMQQAREVFADVFGTPWEELKMNLIYDVCHNIAKFEEHLVNGKKKKVWVHRKGATRAFPPGHPEVPAIYQAIGQPVLIPGDMGRASWVLVGAAGSMEKSFGTTCHGAGRAMSRRAAVMDAGNRKIDKELEARGVIARAQSRKGLAEEQPKAYKNVDEVVEVVHQANLSRKVARMRPIGVIKG